MHSFSIRQNDNFWPAYYIVLAIIQTLWTSETSFPPTPLRLAMIVGMFAPVFFKKELVLIAVPTAIMLRTALATEYNYLPEAINHPFYMGIVILALAVHFRSLNFRVYLTAWPLVVLCLLVVLVDFVCTGAIGDYAPHIFMVLLLLPFIQNSNDFHTISSTIIFCTALLAVYFLINYQKFLETIFAITSTFNRIGWIDPNYFAMLLNQGLLISLLYLAKALHSDRWLFNKWLLITFCIILTVAILLLASRSGFVCLLFNVLMFFCVARIPGRYIFMAALFAIAAIVIMYSFGVFDSILFRLLSEKDVATIGSRTKIWHSIMNQFPRQDILSQMFGGGFGHRLDLSGGKEAHNELLAILSDYGIVGALLFIGFVLSMIRFSITGILRNCVPVMLYVLSSLTLSPFSTLYIGFFIIWIYAYKIKSDDDDLEDLLNNPEVIKAIEEL